MRKHMTRAIGDALAADPRLAYIGEDVEHGGYYNVTEGLAARFPGRVRDFAPDETALVGAGIGFAQAGLLPVVEIPYAKYLDCGADQFHEAATMHWLTNGGRPNGLVLRLQGFDKGAFFGGDGRARVADEAEAPSLSPQACSAATTTRTTRSACRRASTSCATRTAPTGRAAGASRCARPRRGAS